MRIVLSTSVPYACQQHPPPGVCRQHRPRAVLDVHIEALRGRGDQVGGGGEEQQQGNVGTAHVGNPLDFTSLDVVQCVGCKILFSSALFTFQLQSPSSFYAELTQFKFSSRHHQISVPTLQTLDNFYVALTPFPLSTNEQLLLNASLMGRWVLITLRSMLYCIDHDDNE